MKKGVGVKIHMGQLCFYGQYGSRVIIVNPISSTSIYLRADWNLYETYIGSNLDVNISVQTKFDIDNALETLTNSIVEARSIAIPKCEVKFESVIIDDDLKLLIRLKNVRRRQFQRTRDAAMKVVWQNFREKSKNVLHN